jgi:hypothetical protein
MEEKKEELVEQVVEESNKPKRGRPKKFDKNWVEKLYNVEENKKYAQNGEETKIEYILDIIGDGKYLVDLGAKDGYSLSNTRYFIEKGYQCLLIDVDSEAGDSKEIKKHKIFSGNVIPLLKTYKCPKIFDLLSIDLNGTDYWVLDEMLKDFQPKLIIAEFNASIPVGKSLTIKNETDFVWSGDNYFGFSFDAGKKLGEKYGYTVIHQENNMNMFLVKDEYLSGETFDVKYEDVHYFKEDGRKDWVEV